MVIRDFNVTWLRVLGFMGFSSPSTLCYPWSPRFIISLITELRTSMCSPIFLYFAPLQTTLIIIVFCYAPLKVILIYTAVDDFHDLTQGCVVEDVTLFKPCTIHNPHTTRVSLWVVIGDWFSVSPSAILIALPSIVRRIDDDVYHVLISFGSRMMMFIMCWFYVSRSAMSIAPPSFVILEWFNRSPFFG